MQTPNFFDIQRLAEATKNAAYALMCAHDLCQIDVDGAPATRLTGDEDADERQRFTREFLPLVAAWRAARAASEAADALDKIGLPFADATGWSRCLDDRAKL